MIGKRYLAIGMLALFVLGTFLLNNNPEERAAQEAKTVQNTGQAKDLWEMMPNRTCVLANGRTAYRFIRIDRDRGLLDTGEGKKWPVDADHPLNFDAKFFPPGREGYADCAVQFLQQ